MDISCHESKLLNLCRVCGSFIKKTEKQFLVKSYLADIKEVFWLHNVENDDTEIHPPKFSSKCYFSIRNVKKGHAHSQKVQILEKHEFGRHCDVCSRTNTVGR